jgi:hypothetical protein
MNMECCVHLLLYWDCKRQQDHAALSNAINYGEYFVNLVIFA